MPVRMPVLSKHRNPIIGPIARGTKWAEFRIPARGCRGLSNLAPLSCRCFGSNASGRKSVVCLTAGMDCLVWRRAGAAGGDTAGGVRRGASARRQVRAPGGAARLAAVRCDWNRARRERLAAGRRACTWRGRKRLGAPLRLSCHVASHHGRSLHKQCQAFAITLFHLTSSFEVTRTILARSRIVLPSCQAFCRLPVSRCPLAIAGRARARGRRSEAPRFSSQTVWS